MRLPPTEGDFCLEYQHIFSVSHCDCLCFHQIFRLLLQLRDQMAPTHYALNHGKARGVCCVSQQTQVPDQVKLLTASMVHPAQGWDCSRYLQTHTGEDLSILFFLQENECLTLSTDSREGRQSSDTWQRTDAPHFP